MATSRINAFPPGWRGLWRVKQSPYYYKDRWPEAPFGDRWRALKTRMRATVRHTRPPEGTG